MIRLAIVDDERINRSYLESEVRRAWGAPMSIVCASSLAELRSAGGEPFTHALVDLSFGSMDRTGNPIGDTGVDIVDELRANMPACVIAVVTRFDDDPLMPEMVVAIRQTWPEVRFLHKSDAGLVDRVVEMLRGEAVMDNAVFALTLAGQPHVPIPKLTAALRSGIYGGPGARVLRAMSERSSKPTAAELGDELGHGAQYMRSVLHWVGVTLRPLRVLGYDDEAGVGRLWLWARARRAILRRAFPDA